MLALEHHEEAISDFEMAAVTAQGALRTTVLDGLNQARQKQARERRLAQGRPEDGGAGPSAPPATAGMLGAQGGGGCMSCGSSRLDGALLHGTT